MPLTDTQARKAQPGEKDYKLADSGGLYLFVTIKGFKSWRLKYRYAGKEKRLMIGAHPEVSLAAARDERDRARAEPHAHKDPVTEERKRKTAAPAAAGMTFQVVGERWHQAQLGRSTALTIRPTRQEMLASDRVDQRVMTTTKTIWLSVITPPFNPAVPADAPSAPRRPR